MGTRKNISLEIGTSTKQDLECQVCIDNYSNKQARTWTSILRSPWLEGLLELLYLVPRLLKSSIICPYNYFTGKEHWIGLETIYKLTNIPNKPMKLKVSLERFSGEKVDLYYASFNIKDEVRTYVYCIVHTSLKILVGRLYSMKQSLFLSGIQCMMSSSDSFTK